MMLGIAGVGIWHPKRMVLGVLRNASLAKALLALLGRISMRRNPSLEICTASLFCQSEQYSSRVSRYFRCNSSLTWNAPIMAKPLSSPK